MGLYFMDCSVKNCFSFLFSGLITAAGLGRSLGGFVAALMILPWSVSAQAADLCSQASELTFEETHRTAREGVSCYFLEVPSRGTVILYASAPGDSEAEARLVLAPDGEGPTTASFTLDRETPSGLTLTLERAGMLFVLVGPEDPAAPSAGFKIRATFIPARPIKDVDEGDEDGSELDLPVVDGSTPGGSGQGSGGSGPGGPGGGGPGAGGPGGPGGPGSTTAGSMAAGSASASASFRGCGSGGPAGTALDDHGDLPLCATRIDLGGTVVGEIANGMGDDEDFFTFTLHALRRVRIEATSGHLTLYDANGHRLASSAQELAEPARLVRTLASGRYYLRVQSLWLTEEPYSLSVGSFDRL